MNTQITGQPIADSLDYDSIQVGMIFETEHSFTHDDLLQFARLSGDYSPLHVDPVYAAETEFKTCVVHGILLSSLFSQLVGMKIPGKPALYLGQDLTFRRPVLINEKIRASAKVTGKVDATRSILLSTEIRTEDGKTAVSGSAKVKIRGNADPRHTSQKVNSPNIKTKKVAVITGGTGGLGSAIAKLFIQHGIAVALLFHSNQNRADNLVAELQDAGGAAMAIKADIVNPDEIHAAMTQIVEHLGEPAIVIHAATSPLQQRPVYDTARADFQTHLDIQVHAAVEVVRSAYPYMKNAGGGAVVNIASQVTADVPPARMIDYVTAKYALLGLSKSLAVEWAEDNIRVNVVSPGLVQTEMTQHYHDRIFKMEAARTPLKRIATPEDVARSVLFLVSDENNFITGLNLFVTGGQVML